MEEKESLFENIKRRLTTYEKVSPREYLFYIGVANIPKLSFLKDETRNVLENPELIECKKVTKQYNEEGLKQIADAYEEFKNKTTEMLKEQADKDYENKKFSYDGNVVIINKQRELLEGTLARIDTVSKYEELAELGENLKKNLDILSKQEESLKEPTIETVEEYKARVSGLYEDAIKQYSEGLEKEKDYTLEALTEYAKDFVKGLGNEENNN